jgi:hypothetical protein
MEFRGRRGGCAGAFRAFRVLVILLLAEFPAVFGLAWIYELTGDGRVELTLCHWQVGRADRSPRSMSARRQTVWWL